MRQKANREFGDQVTKDLLGIYLDKDVEAVYIPIETYKAFKSKLYDYEMVVCDLELLINKLISKYFDKEYDEDIVGDFTDLLDLILDSGVRK